jgi:hypothetical protein
VAGSEQNFRCSVPQGHDLHVKSRMKTLIHVMQEPHKQKMVPGSEPTNQSVAELKATYLMGISSHRNTKGPGKSEISQFQVVALVDEEVLRLEVAMKNPMRMTIEKTGGQLMCKFLF